MEATNPMIQEAMDLGEDTAGLCTVRQLAAEMLNGPRIGGECVCELMFIDGAGRRINIECAVTAVDGVQHARGWVPKFNITRMLDRWCWAFYEWRLARQHRKWQRNNNGTR